MYFKASESDAQTDEFKTSLKRQNDVLSGDILEELAQNPKITYASGVKVNYEKFSGLAGAVRAQLDMKVKPALICLKVGGLVPEVLSRKIYG